jgi:predicted metal-binding membrane protein
MQFAPSSSRTDLWCLLAGIALLIVASWGYLVYEDWAMRHMDVVAMAMPGAGPWSSADLLLVFIMWAVMMIAMMLPSAVPMLLIYRRLAASSGRAGLQSTIFAAGYLCLWTAFSLAATIAQWGLHTLTLVTPAAVLTNRWIAAALLVAAGVYQLSAAKRACLTRCSTPLQFLHRQWRDGPRGAWRMGLWHGGNCIGCCWLLMALLFVYGVMNLAWIAGLTLFVLCEKLIPPNRWLPRLSAAVFIGWGVAVALWHG